MAVIDKKGKIFGKINIFDLFIVLLIIAVAAWGFNHFYLSNNNEAKASEKIEYDLEIKGVDMDYADAVKIGDIVRDASKGNKLGIITNKQVSPSVNLNTDIVNGKFVKIPIPKQYDLLITLDSSGAVTPRAIIVEGVELKIGKKMSIKGKGYADTGFILGIRTKK